MILLEGTHKGSKKSAELNNLYFSGYWADTDGNKIDKISFGSKVRFYAEKWWVHNVEIRVFLKPENGKEVEIKLDSIQNLIPLYYLNKERYFEIQLGKKSEYEELKEGKDVELYCGVSNGLGWFYLQEHVAKMKLVVSCFCDKEHIDLRSQLEYQTQFDSKFGNDKEQRVACFKACKTILTNAGLSSSSAPNDASVIQAASEVADTVDKANQVSYLSINAEAAQRGIMYIDEQLESGFPVLVGVDHTQGNKYNEGTTDHFIVIVGRGCDDNKAWYLFYEVGTAQIENGLYKGEMDGNKLYLDSDNKLYGSPYHNSNRKYVVTQIRKNKQ